MKKTQVAFITTINHNVGDDFVREGIKYLLKKSFPERNFSFENIDKHFPITVRKGFWKIKNSHLGLSLDKLLPRISFLDKIFSSEVVIQAGAPVYWCNGNKHCFNNIWYKPLILDRLAKTKIPLLNISAGTCQTYHSNGEDFCDDCLRYIGDLFSKSLVTTVRDSLSEKILSSISLKTFLTPCASIFASDYYGIKADNPEYVVLNYMSGGAHYTLGQNIDFEKWQKEFSKFYFYLKNIENVVFSCHDEREVEEVLKIDPKAKIFYKKNDFVSYLSFYSKAKMGILNRVHGAFAIASFGRPSIVVGNDSRAKMVETIGLESFFVNDVNSELLISKYETLKKELFEYEEKMNKIKKEAFEMNLEILKKSKIFI